MNYYNEFDPKAATIGRSYDEIKEAARERSAAVFVEEFMRSLP